MLGSVAANAKGWGGVLPWLLALIMIGACWWKIDRVRGVRHAIALDRREVLALGLATLAILILLTFRLGELPGPVLTWETVTYLTHMRRLLLMKAMILAGPLLVALYLAATSAALFVGLHLLRAGIAFGSVFATVVHAAVPPALCKGLLALAVVLKRDTLALDDLDTLVVSNIAAFLPEDAPRALRVAGDALDLFAVWKWVLIVIGLAIVSRVSRRNAALLAGGVWGGWLAIRILLPSLRS